MKRSDLVTVIVTVFNKEPFVQQCIDSVLAQSHRHVELIVINDGSTDASGHLIENSSDPRLRLISQDNSGVCLSRNTGLTEATGEWVIFLDGDDWLDPGQLESLLAHSSGDTDIVVSDWITVDHRDACKQEHRARRLTEPELLAGSPWILHAAMIRRSFLSDHNLRFPPELNRSSCEDNRFWFQVCSFTNPHLVDYKGAYYRTNVVDSRTLDEDSSGWVRGFIKSARLNLDDIDSPQPAHFACLTGAIENVIGERGQRIDRSTYQELLSFHAFCLAEYFRDNRAPGFSMIVRRVVGVRIFSKMKRLQEMIGP